MSYSVRQTKSKFHMKKEYEKQALLALKKVCDKKSLEYKTEVLRARSLDAAMEACGFQLSYQWLDPYQTECGDFDGIEMTTNYPYQEDKVLNAIAPYVEEGSFIQLIGEDGQEWRWLFHDGRCITINPTITWPNPNTEKSAVTLPDRSGDRMKKGLVFGATGMCDIPEGYNDVFVFVPAEAEIIRIEEGSGCNLDKDDLKAGYVDSIEYYQYDMKDDMDEVDGGTMLLKEEVQKKYKRLADCIPDVLDMIYGETDLEYIILAAECAY